MSVDAIGDIAARLIATPAIADQTTDGSGPGIFRKCPHDFQSDVGYRPVNERPFIFFGPVQGAPLSDCGGFTCTMRIFVESFKADNSEAHALIRAVIAALDARYGAADFNGFDPVCLSFGEVAMPFSPCAVYAEFQWSE